MDSIENKKNFGKVIFENYKNRKCKGRKKIWKTIEKNIWKA
jgi:hypothetical protein